MTQGLAAAEPMPCNVPGGEECTDGTLCSETDPAATGAECVRTPRQPTHMRVPCVGYSCAHGYTFVQLAELAQPVEMPPVPLLCIQHTLCEPAHVWLFLTGFCHAFRQRLDISIGLARSVGCAAPVQPLPSYALQLFACLLLNACTAAAPCAVPVVTLISAGPIIQLSVTPPSAGSIFLSAPPFFPTFPLPDSGADGILTVDLSDGPITIGPSTHPAHRVSVAVLLELTELAKPVEMPCLCCSTLGGGAEPQLQVVGLSPSFPIGGLTPFTPAGAGLLEADAALQSGLFAGPPPGPNLLARFDFIGAL